MSEAWIIDACRSPRGIGKPEKGALASMHPQHVAASVLKAIAARNAIDTAEVDDIIWGTSAQVGAQSGDLARMAALDAGYDLRASAVTLDRFCGSGITSVSLAAAMVMSGMEDLLIAGGTEMMSMPARRLGDGPPMMDSGNLRLRLSHPQSHQGVCADAYLAKPFNPRELVARIQSVLRRSRLTEMPGAPSTEPQRMQFGDFELDLSTRSLRKAGVPIPLTTSDFATLKALARHAREPLSRQRLMQLSRGRDYESSDRSLDVQISRLRKLLEDDPHHPRYLQTVWGVGYVLIPDQDEATGAEHPAQTPEHGRL